MDKRTVVAVVLSVVVISLSMMLQGLIWPKQPAALPPLAQSSTEKPAQSEAPAKAQAAPAGAPATLQAAPGGSLVEQTVTLANDVVTITFSSRGAVATSVKLNRHRNRDGQPVEKVLAGTTGQYPFAIQFGDYQAPATDAVFAVEGPWSDRSQVVFTRQFVAPSGVPFTLRKTFTLNPSEYMVELRVDLENSVNEYLDATGTTYAYTLSFGPQIGPAYEKLDQRNEFREYTYREAGKKKTLRMPREGVKTLVERLEWASITGKYFTVVAVPDATKYDVVYDVQPLSGIKDRSSMYFSRPQAKAAKSSDVFRFYMGPKQRDVLARYDDKAKNGFAVGGLHLTDTLSTSVLIGWLATILQFMLQLLYKVIPNYGVAIILLTIIIKFLLYPLSRKSFESTARMQKLNPKIEELRVRYKGKPELMNKELAAFYKKEGINPLGGCLPLLLQLPIFFAFYNLLNTQFELRGAPFIRPWISDLSGPESVLSFGFTIPLLGWSDLKILPFFMLATTFLQTMVSQTPDTGQSNTKLLQYAMPVVFFFILYNMPSGLVLYWTFQNITGIVQQLVVNRATRKRVAAAAVTSVEGRAKR
jgi:YidC/Oxa1 family membrane protein insertase